MNERLIGNPDPPWSDPGGDMEMGCAVMDGNTDTTTYNHLGPQGQVSAVLGGEANVDDRTNVEAEAVSDLDSESIRADARYHHITLASARLRGLAPATSLRGSGSARLRSTPVADTATTTEPACSAGSDNTNLTDHASIDHDGASSLPAVPGTERDGPGASGFHHLIARNCAEVSHFNVGIQPEIRNNGSLTAPSSPAPSYRTWPSDSDHIDHHIEQQGSEENEEEDDDGDEDDSDEDDEDDNEEAAPDTCSEVLPAYPYYESLPPPSYTTLDPYAPVPAVPTRTVSSVTPRPISSATASSPQRPSLLPFPRWKPGNQHLHLPPLTTHTAPLTFGCTAHATQGTGGLRPFHMSTRFVDMRA